MAVGTTALIAAGIGAAGAVGGAAINAGAQGRAQAAQEDAQTKAMNEQKRQADQALAFLKEQSEKMEPLRQAQLGATEQLQGLSQANNPFEQLQRNIGTEAIQRQLAAQGLLRSTAQGDQLGSLEAGLAQNRAAILQYLAGNGAAQAQGQLAIGQAGIAQNLGQQIGSGFQNIGQAQAAGALAGGQIGSTALGQFGNIGQNIVSELESVKQQKMKDLQAQVDMFRGIFGKQ